MQTSPFVTPIRGRCAREPGPDALLAYTTTVIVVDDLDAAIAGVTRIVGDAGGRVHEIARGAVARQHLANLQTRVPLESALGALEEVHRLGAVDSDNRTLYDATADAASTGCLRRLNADAIRGLEIAAASQPDPAQRRFLEGRRTALSQAAAGIPDSQLHPLEPGMASLQITLTSAR